MKLNAQLLRKFPGKGQKCTEANKVIPALIVMVVGTNVDDKNAWRQKKTMTKRAVCQQVKTENKHPIF